MNARTRLALARVQVTDVVRLLNRRLHAAGYHAAAALLIDCALDIADDLARERAQMETTHDHD